MSGSPVVDRLQQLETIEQQIGTALQYAGQSLMEISKDKSSNRQVENHTVQFLKSLVEIENGLSQQISYLTQVSTGQPHERSTYAAQKDLQMAHFSNQHVRRRLAELEKLKNDNLKQVRSAAQGMDQAQAHQAHAQAQAQAQAQAYKRQMGFPQQQQQQHPMGPGGAEGGLGDHGTG